MTAGTSSPPAAGMRSAAIRLATRGFRVFPLRPGAKKPLRKGWQDEATSDAFKVLETWPGDGCAPGVATGSDFTILDADIRKGGLEGLAALDLPRTFAVRTASGGLHAYFRTPAGMSFANSVSKLASGVDVRGTGGLVVGPGAVIAGGCYAVEVDAPIAELPAHIVERLRLAAPKAPEAGKVIGDLDTPAALERARLYLLTEAPTALEGSGGDQQTIIVANRVLDFGIEPETALDLMAEHWNEQRADPPWDYEDLARKVANAAKYRTSAIGRETPGRHFEVIARPLAARMLEFPNEVSLAELIAAQSNALVRGLIHPGETIMLYGDSTAGKTFVALDMGWHIASGKDWHGRKVKQGPVLYVNLEGSTGFRKRTLAAQKVHGDPGRHFARLTVHASLVKGQAGAEGAEKIIAAGRQLAELSGQPVGLIVIDTLRRAIAGDDENSTEHIMHFIEQRVGHIQRQTGAAVLYVHHTNREGSYAGNASNFGANDVVLCAQRKGDVRWVTAEKVKDGEEGRLITYHLEVVPLGLDDEDRPVTSCVIRAIANPVERATRDAPPTPGSRMPKHQRIFFDAYEAVMARRGTGDESGILVPEVRSEFIEIYTAGKSDKRSRDTAARKFRTSMQELRSVFRQAAHGADIAIVKNRETEIAAENTGQADGGSCG